MGHRENVFNVEAWFTEQKNSQVHICAWKMWFASQMKFSLSILVDSFLIQSNHRNTETLQKSYPLLVTKINSPKIGFKKRGQQKLTIHMFIPFR